MSCLGGVLGWFWIFVKNFFEGHTNPPPRSAFAPPVPLRNEPGCFDLFTNLLCVNLLQQWYTCLSVAMSVKISVFGGVFLAGRFCVYITQMNFLFYRFFYLFFDSFVLIRFYRWFVLFVLLCFVPIVSRGGAVSLLTRELMCHVIALPYYLRLRFEVSKTCHVILRLKIWRVTTLWSCFAVEDLPRYLRFVCRPAVSSWVALRLQLLQLLGYPSTTPAACR